MINIDTGSSDSSSDSDQSWQPEDTPWHDYFIMFSSGELMTIATAFCFEALPLSQSYDGLLRVNLDGLKNCLAFVHMFHHQMYEFFFLRTIFILRKTFS